MQARALSGAARAQAVAHAQDLVRSTTQLRLDDGSLVSVDDSALAEAIGARGADIDGAIRDLAALEELARGPAVDLRTADARLQALVGAQRAQDAEVSVVDLVIRFIQRWVQEGLGPAADPRIRVVAEYGIGLALVVVVLAIIGRDLRERFRREVTRADLGSTHRADPAVQLRLAEEALRAGDPRAAIHALYLYAIRALAAREALRYDPSFTDRELLATARAIPHADALRDLVTLHELIWYGLRDAHTEDAARARRLAVEAAA